MININKLEKKFTKSLQKEYINKVFVAIDEVDVYRDVDDRKKYYYTIKGRYGQENITSQHDFEIEYVSSDVSYSNLVGMFMLITYMKEEEEQYEM